MSTPAERIIVIGAGMVGHRFVDELTRADRERRFAITLLGAEAYEPYNRIMLSDVLAGRADLRAIGLPLPAERVDFRRGVSAQSLQVADRTVTLSDGSLLSYDRLVLATGARAFVPPLPGLEERPRHVHVLRTWDDCRDLSARALTAKSAVVLGGGVLGLEAACGLRRRGVPVTVLDLDAHLMATQLPAAPAEVLAGQLADLGIDVRTGTSVAELISAYGELVACRLTDGTVLAADLLLVSCGIRAETALARDAGLVVDRGIVVDAAMSTGDPAIFAIGDCAQPPSGMTGLLAPGWRQAEALADAFIRGLPTEVSLPPAEGVKLKAAGADLIMLGEQSAERVITVHDPVGRRHLSLAVTGETLIGFTAVGSPEVAASLAVAFERRTPLPLDPLSLLIPAARTEEASPLRMPGDTTVCRCNNVSKKDIVAAWEAGADTVEEVAVTTRATTGCGGCSSVVCGLVDWLNESDPSAPQIEQSSRSTPETQRIRQETTTS